MKKFFKIFMSVLLAAVSVLNISFFAYAEKNDNSKSGDSSALPVKIAAKSAILCEVTSGKVLMEYNADEKLYPASVTKIMTVLLTVEALGSGKISLTDKVACSKNAASKGGSQIWLEEGEEMTVDELLKATVIGSANDAATLLGEYVSGSEEAFIARMNERAAELSMTNTHFENATGLDDTTDTHKTTARDIAIMSCELLKHDIIRNYSTVWMDSLRDGATELVNTNKLVRFFSGTTGLKTGTTAKAGCCVSASCERDGLHLVAVVMGSDNSSDRFETAKAMLSWGFSNYAVVTPEVDMSLITDVKIIGGEKSAVTPKVPEIKSILVKKGDEGKLKQEVELALDAEAPVVSGQKLGSITFTLEGEAVAKYDIVSDCEVKKLTFFTALKRIAAFLKCGALPQ